MVHAYNSDLGEAETGRSLASHPSLHGKGQDSERPCLKNQHGDWKMFQQSKNLLLYQKMGVQIPEPTVWLTNANFSSKRCNNSLWPSWAPLHTCAHTQTYIKHGQCLKTTPQDILWLPHTAHINTCTPKQKQATHMHTHTYLQKKNYCKRNK